MTILSYWFGEKPTTLFLMNNCLGGSLSAPMFLLAAGSFCCIRELLLAVVSFCCIRELLLAVASLCCIRERVLYS